MIFGYLVIVSVIAAVIYYIYRQNNDPGTKIFFLNASAKGLLKRNKQAEPSGESEPYPGQGPKK